VQLNIVKGLNASIAGLLVMLEKVFSHNYYSSGSPKLSGHFTNVARVTSNLI